MELGDYHNTKQGTPQGGIVSPILANIYLHYVLDLWFKKEFSAIAIGQVDLVRYCDDYVAFFSHQKTADRFQSEMIARLKKFNLEISPEKTNLIDKVLPKVKTTFSEK